jgi:hypothetical protein
VVRTSSRIGAFVVGAVVAGVIAVAVGVSAFLLSNPFTSTTVDRTPPPVLQALSDIAEYHAATGQFQVLVDIENDVDYLPAVLAGERAFFIGQGTVDAYVDFSTLDESAVEVDGTTVTITLPAARLDDPALDLEASHVAARERGLLNRVSGVFSARPTDDQPLYQAASDKLREAAAATELRVRAEENTREMLVGLLTAVGYEQVTVVFEEPDPT